MADDDDVWRELRRLDERATAQERALDRHLGECSVRHQEIIRRHEEATRDRTQFRVDLAAAESDHKQLFADLTVRTEAIASDARKAVDQSHAWTVGLVLSIAGGSIVIALGVILKLMKIY